MVEHLTRQAERLVVEAEGEPARVLAEAQAILAGPPVASVANVFARAGGIAARALGEFELSEQLLTQAVNEGQGRDRGLALVSRSGLAAITGRFDAAFADLASADLTLETLADRAVLAGQVAVVHHQAGQLDKAEDQYTVAVALAGEAGLAVTEARARSNLAVLATHRGEYHSASDQLRAAAELYRHAGHPNRLLVVEHNLGYVALCRGRIVDALNHFDRSRAAASEAGMDPFDSSADRCTALMIAGLTDEAERDSLAAARHFGTTGASVAQTDALVSAGRAALAAAEPERAVSHLAQALRMFEPGIRTVWRAVAVALHAEAVRRSSAAQHSGAPGTGDLDSAISVLDDAGMGDEAATARLIAQRGAVARGDVSAAQRLGEQLRPGGLTAPVAPLYWLAAGELRSAMGLHRSAQRAFATGLRANARLRSSMSGLELSASLGPIGQDLAEAGLQSALQAQRPAPLRALRWMDAGLPVMRAQSVSNDDGVEVRAAELAVAEALRTDADQAGAGDSNDDGRGASGGALRTAIGELRRAERSTRSRHRTPQQPKPSATGPTKDVVARLAELDGDLLQIGRCGSSFVLVSRIDGRLRIHDPVDVALARKALAELRSRMRLSWAGPETAIAFGGVEVAAARLDELLIPEVLHDDASRRPLLVVLPPELRAMPLGSLPRLRGRAFMAATRLQPSTGRSNTPAVHGSGGLFVAGPGLDAAHAEIATSASAYRGAVTLAGSDATASTVLAHLASGTPILHLACHGRVRDDSPLFSALDLADGPLMVHDLVAVEAMPSLVVLSACDVGRQASGGRSYTLGLADVFVALGTEAVVAAPMAVPDRLTATMMIEFHRLLGDGDDVGTALMRLRMSPDPQLALIAAAFMPYGTAGRNKEHRKIAHQSPG